MNCDPKITTDLLYDCTLKAIKGLANGKGVLINFDDIDRAGSTEAEDIISDLVLGSGLVGFGVEWYKDLGIMDAAFTPNTEGEDGFTHGFACRLQVPTSGAAKRAKELKEGLFVIVAEGRFKGTLSEDAFKVQGWQVGLKATEITWSSNENSASILFKLSTEEGSNEDYPYNTFLEGTYAVSKATFDTKFATI